MAFIEKNLALLAGEATGGYAGKGNVANRAPRIWSYATRDSITTVRGNSYFDGSTFSKEARKGDLFYVVRHAVADFETDATGDPDGAQLMVVMANNNGVIDLSDGTAVSVTNT